MPRDIRVMHFADTHFGVELYGRLDPDTGLNTRLQDFKRSLTSAIESALERGIDLAVFAGDAYKSRDPRQTDQREFANCIRLLTQQNIPVVMLIGNHDMPAIRGRANAIEIYRTLGVTGVQIVSRPEMFLVETPAGKVRIVGIPYLLKGFSVAKEEYQGKTLEETRLLLEEKYSENIAHFAKQIRDANDDIPTILLGHFWANGAKLSSWQEGYFSRDEAQVAVASLRDPAFDYVALGHIHKHQDLNKNGQPHIVYSGSPDKIDFGEKDEEKGYVYLNLRKGGADYQFVRTPETRPLLDIDVDADCEEPTEKIVSAIQCHSLRNAIVKLSYRIGADRQSLVREREIKDALAPAFMTVSIQRRIQRDSATRSLDFTEGKTPRENLELYIEKTPNYQVRKERLLEMAEPLFAELAEESAE